MTVDPPPLVTRAPWSSWIEEEMCVVFPGESGSVEAPETLGRGTQGEEAHKGGQEVLVGSVYPLAPWRSNSVEREGSALLPLP